MGPAWNEKLTPSMLNTVYHPAATPVAGAYADTCTVSAPVLPELGVILRPLGDALALDQPPTEPASAGAAAAGRPVRLNACASAGPAGTTAWERVSTQ